MKIFQGVIEIAGQMGILCGALKERGHLAAGYNTFHTYLGYQDHLINTDLFEIQKMSKHILNFFDVFHYHYGVSMYGQFKDLKINKARGKKMIMHHWGNDVRFHNLARINNPYVYTGDSPPDNVIHKNLKNISQYISEAIVQDYEVLPYVEPYYKKVHVLPLAIDLRKFIPEYPNENTKQPLILHAPTNPDFKGTTYIEEAINQLKPYYNFKYIRIEKMSHAKAISLYRKADIIVDQILCGSYGLLCVESMALGKPVIAYIRPDIIDKFPTEIPLPIVNGNPNNIIEKLIFLIENPGKRKSLGIEGRKYVRKYHSRQVVVKKLLSIYRNLS
ncbi:glycosyltransferase family 4 protein [Candidatus Contubernalis alkaliaceticus]|uniref:glycosyltransferase family 4 protein n=1 Tax=Candidatus Contubernalis alkaliaceticus TaxID=338645 RepID=UPI001F4C1A0B|nr:glycosyltransferase family 4 protein [Candidatus Contubernalis alkalaceticus]UNC92302.1 glycosyltransferase family 4 protein [Candidatus Contubernalis alkalaceticus]